MRSLAIGRRASKQCWGVTAGKAMHNSSSVRGVTAGKMGRNSSITSQEIHCFKFTLLRVDQCLFCPHVEKNTASISHYSELISVFFVHMSVRRT